MAIRSMLSVKHLYSVFHASQTGGDIYVRGEASASRRKRLWPDCGSRLRLHLPVANSLMCIRSPPCNNAIDFSSFCFLLLSPRWLMQVLSFDTLSHSFFILATTSDHRYYAPHHSAPRAFSVYSALATSYSAVKNLWEFLPSQEVIFVNSSRRRLTD